MGEEASGNATATEPGMDDYLFAKAQAAGKSIRALETVRDQAHTLVASADLRKQAALLVPRVTGKSLDGEAHQLAMSAQYRSRKIPYYFGYHQTTQFEKALGETRNLKWMEQLPAIIKKKHQPSSP